MYEKTNGIRYPFVITDEAGYVLLSCPEIIKGEECFFSAENFSAEELDFLFGMMREYRFGDLILLKERKKGRAVFVSPFLFSSTRTLVMTVSDIDYNTAAAICAYSHKDIAIREIPQIKFGKRHEKVYEDICNIVYSLGNSTKGYSYKENFGEYLINKVNAVSHITFCQPEINFEPASIGHCPENLDAAILGLYLIVMMSAASFASGERRVEIDFSVKDHSLCVKVSFSALMDKALLLDFEKRFLYAVAMIDSLCAENNLPMYFYRDGFFRSGIIPCRIENSFIGLKARAGFLKDEKEKEQKERNIFLSASTANK